RQYGLSRFGGVIREVQKNKRIVFTFQWDGDSGRDCDTLVTVTFADKEGNTIQTFHQAPFSSVTIRDSHIGGWNSLFNKQQVYVENIAVAEQNGFHA
ncbi:MAG: SRPBCC domain-containing protein, partial [Bradyrhizobium sp.]